MATHSSILAWQIPWTEEPGRLLVTQAGYMGSPKRWIQLSGVLLMLLVTKQQQQTTKVRTAG